MIKKCYRYFGGLLNTQAKWLNKMSEKGYRLVRTGKLLYEFEKCKPDEVTKVIAVSPFLRLLVSIIQQTPRY